MTRPGYLKSKSNQNERRRRLQRRGRHKKIRDGACRPAVAVEVQFGKYAFVAFDLFVKHMAFFVGDVIDIGVEILPMKELQAKMSSGPGYYEGELYNLVRQGRGVPAVPLIIVGVAP